MLPANPCRSCGHSHTEPCWCLCEEWTPVPEGTEPFMCHRKQPIIWDGWGQPMEAHR